MAKRKRRLKWKAKVITAKARERLHALRMKFKPGYADEHLKSLGFNVREIGLIKAGKRVPYRQGFIRL